MKLSLVIPTYNEKENIEKLIHSIYQEFEKNNIKGEIIAVDDNSPDGTGNILEKLKKKIKILKVIHREKKAGLSSAVINGWNHATGDILAVIDADLSHPVSKLKEMYALINTHKADLVIGSRYTKGGKILGWNFKRKLMSQVATIIGKLFTPVNDPMTGFLMIKKSCLKNAKINPKGFKILLEILIKANYNKIVELPITFVNRKKGKSKVSTKEIIYYLQNILGYIFYKKRKLKK